VRVASEIATFLGIVLVLTITPGVDMALVMRAVLAHGFRAVWPTIAGIVTGVSIHVTLCVAGLSVVLRQSDAAYTTVRLVGAAWLAWMGISTIWGIWRDRAGNAADAGSSAGTDAGPRASGDTAASARERRLAAAPPNRVLYRRGLLTNILNVKIALFYIAFLPQFAPAGDRFVPIALGLALVQASIGVSWLVTYALIVDRAGRALESNPRVRRWLESSTGAALLGFGVRLATASR